MAEVLSPTQPTFATVSEPLQLTAETRLPPPTQNTNPLVLDTTSRNGQLSPDTFSPVNQKGHFEFDRVLKSGVVYKRTRKTKVDTSVLFGYAGC